VGRLLVGQPEVLRLIEKNPFPEKPPRFVRTTVWKYEFSTPAERAEGIWWKRKEIGPFRSIMMFKDGRAIPVTLKEPGSGETPASERLRPR
jgi:hypothetical protein